MNCPRCNQIVDEHAVMCPNCGMVLNQNNSSNYLENDNSKNFFEFPQNNQVVKKEKISMNNNNITKIIIIIVALLFIGIGSFVVYTVLNNNNTETKSNDKSTEQVLDIMSDNNLINYDMTSKVENAEKSYVFMPNDMTYQILYTRFNESFESQKSYEKNKELLISANPKIVELTNTDNDTLKIYEATTAKEYIYLLCNDKTYFQIVVKKENQNNIKLLMSNFN